MNGEDPQNFPENYAYLRDNGVIPPEYPTVSVPDEVKVMIAGLSQAEMERLRDICVQTNSFLYLNVQDARGIFCGL